MGLFLVTIAAFFDLLISTTQSIRFFLTVLLFAVYLIDTVIRLRRNRYLDLLTVIQACTFALFIFYYSIFRSYSFVYLLTAKISHYFTSFIGLAVSKPLDLGITYSGIHLVLLFFFASTATFFLGKKTSAKRYGLSIVATIFIWAFYCMLWMVLAENSLTLGLNNLEPITGPLNFCLLLFALLLGTYKVFYGDAVKFIQPIEFKKKEKGLLTGVGVLILVMAIAAFLPVGGVSPPEGRVNVTIWDSGINFDVPGLQSFGLDQVGMFGLLPHYLTKNGYYCRVETSITKKILEETDIYVIINPMIMPEQDELELLWEFVHKGGSILAVGDHTGQEQIRDPLNAVLKPAKISFNFDSAIPFKSLWANEFILRRSSLFQGVSDRQLQLVVGASLETGFGSRPLVIGRSGYSDEGDLKNEAEGFLGDMHFNRGERIGDLVLAAEADYGKGKFLAFGDTTHLQNTVLAYSYPFIDNTFAYLSPDRSLQDGRNSVNAQYTGYDETCMIDLSHMEKVSLDKSGNAADGLIATALRASYMPVINMTDSLRSFIEDWDDLGVIVIMEPAFGFSEEEMRALDLFMEEGGTIFFTGDYESPKATQDFAAYYGFSFDNMAIGRIAPAKNSEMALWNGCPLIYNGELLKGDTEEVKTLLDVWDYSVIAEKQVGKGRLYIFADPDFLKNKNVEASDSYRIGNIDFILGLLEENEE